MTSAKNAKTAKKSKKPAIIIAAILVLTAALIAAFRVYLNHRPVKLDEEYYTETSEILELNKEEYENLLSEKKSFVLMVDNSGCMTTAKMREMLENISEKFTYYRIYWPEARNTNIKNYINYFPSVMVVENGAVKFYLRADKDEDAIYYNDETELKNWLKSKIQF